MVLVFYYGVHSIPSYFISTLSSVCKGYCKCLYHLIGGIGALHALGVQVEVDDNGGIQRPDIHKYKKRNNEDENRLCTDIIYGKHLPNIRRIFPPANQILPGREDKKKRKGAH